MIPVGAVQTVSPEINASVKKPEKLEKRDFALLLKNKMEELFKKGGKGYGKKVQEEKSGGIKKSLSAKLGGAQFKMDKNNEPLAVKIDTGKSDKPAKRELKESLQTAETIAAGLVFLPSEALKASVSIETQAVVRTAEEPVKGEKVLLVQENGKADPAKKKETKTQGFIKDFPAGERAENLTADKVKGKEKEGEIALKVTDLRKRGQENTASGSLKLAGSKAAETPVIPLEIKPDNTQNSVKENAAVAGMEKNGDNVQENRGGIKGIKETFKDQFDRILKDEIVKQTGIILKTEQSGEIRLVLKPENLGRVRIRISLEDNHIAGRIIVENNNVKELFEQNLASLSRALSDQGYQMGNLDVSVGGGKNGSGDALGRERVTSPLIRKLEDSMPFAFETAEEAHVINVMA